MLMIAARTHVDYVGCTSMVFHSSSVKSCKNDGTREMGSRVQCNGFGDETNQRLVEPGMSAKRVDTSMRLVGDDLRVAAGQKQMQTKCELSMWEILVCECDDRLEIKQFPYSPRQEALPRYEFFDSDESCLKLASIAWQRCVEGEFHESRNFHPTTVEYCSSVDSSAENTQVWCRARPETCLRGGTRCCARPVASVEEGRECWTCRGNDAC